MDQGDQGDQGEVAPPSGGGHHPPHDVHERQPAQHKAEGATLHDADGGHDRLQDTRCNGDQGSSAAMLSVSTPFSPVGTPGSCAPLSSSALAGLVSSAHDGSGASSSSHHLLSGALLNGGGGSVRPAHPQQSEQAPEGGAAAAEARERGDAGASSCSSSPSSTSRAPHEEPGCGSDASDDSSGSACGAHVHSGDSMHSTPAVPSSFGGGGCGRPMMGGDPGSQICYDFTKGLCSRGDKCKFSHDIATIVQFNSKEKGICFDYLRNQCHRGLLCRFSHDLSNIAQQCQVFNSNGAAVAGGVGGGMAGGPGGAPGGGPMPTKNRSGSICYDFVKGVCSRGPDCRYSHDLTLIARMARTSNGGAAGGPDADGGADVCFDFLRGRCSRGDGCKYSHNPALLGGGLGGLGAVPNPLLHGGFAGSPGMLFDPAALAAAAAAGGGAGWPLAGMTPQTAAAAAAAAAYTASGGNAGLSHKLGMMGLGGGEFGVPPPGMGGPGRGSFDGSGLGNDPLAMLMAMQQQNPMLAAAAAAAAAAAGGMRPPQGPGLPPLSVNARGPGMGPPGGRMPGHGGPTPEQLQLLMATNPELGRLLSKSAPGNGSGGNLMLPPHSMPGGGPMLPPFGGPHSSLGMNEQRMSPDGLSAGMPIPPHLLHPRLAALASSGSLGSDSPAGSPGSSMSMGELLAAAAAARGAHMHGQHSNSVGDMAAMRAAAAAASRSAPMSNLGGGAPGRLSPPGALSGPGPRGPGDFQHHHHYHHAAAAAAAAAAQKHAMDVAAAASAGMVMPPPAGPGGIGASRGANAQAAAAAAAAIAAVAARSAEGGGPAISQADILASMEGGPEGTMLPLLQEIWSR